MRKRWFFALVLLLAACQQAVGTQIPTAFLNTPTPVVETTPIPEPPATPTMEKVVEAEEVLEVHPINGCYTSETMTVMLREQMQALVDAGQAALWEAPNTVEVELITGSGVGYDCAYQIRLWGTLYDSFSDIRNVEFFSEPDMISLTAAAQKLDSDAYLVVFDWVEGLRSVLPESDVKFDKHHGGFILYIHKP